MIGTDPESNTGGIRSVKTGLFVLPVTGWGYVVDDTWNYDSHLTISGKSSAKPHLDGLVLFSVNPATHPPPTPATPTRESLFSNISQWMLTK